MGFFDSIFNIKKARKDDDMVVVHDTGDIRLPEKGYMNMDNDLNKSKALKMVAPLSFILSRIGSMASDGVPYVVDKENNENDDKESKRIRSLIENPNELQDFSQFVKCVEISIRLYGFCPIYLLRATEKSPVIRLLPIPPQYFHIRDVRQEDIILKNFDYPAYIDVEDGELKIESYEYAIIHDGMYNVDCGELRFFSPISSLSDQVRNYIGQIRARGNLIINGGPKGIIHGNDTSEFGNLELTPREKDELNRGFRDKYGLVDKPYQIMVTRAKVGWLSLSYDVSQLQLHEEDRAVMQDISNAIGVNPNLFISDSTFQNQEAVKKSVYQDVIIPDAHRIARSLTNILCPEGIYIKIDYTDVPCLQVDFSSRAMALKNMAAGLETLLSNGIITTDEARIEVSKHIDINPTKNN